MKGVFCQQTQGVNHACLKDLFLKSEEKLNNKNRNHTPLWEQNY